MIELKLLIVSSENVFSDVISHLLNDLCVKSDVISLSELKNSIEIIKQYDGLIYAGGGEASNQSDDHQIIKQLKQQLPIFGVGSGMQAIVCAFGGRLVKSQKPVFGENSMISHLNKGVFINLPKRFNVVRYHAFIVDKNTFPNNELMITAEEENDCSIMAIKHRVYPIEGVQFNPESIQTNYGKELFEAFVQTVKSTKLSYA
ncbi:gamma-glutamyl-gamma-aminobutyrate hydrolase family protein [Thiotrichales bacterium 19S3-7]|nr:gamma-glutamyl-gamma-aminobutyrate hydrolase family protein [Thiotrichales bacterium 19S3-7]MCF6801973.1 gamma-glutamyl-gamma-aminobutyrate hydrolase family protein [Thiotrichales bacterium 19S3-11]